MWKAIALLRKLLNSQNSEIALTKSLYQVCGQVYGPTNLHNPFNELGLVDNTGYTLYSA